MSTNTDTNKYTILFAIGMVVVVGSLLAFTASSLKPNIKENERMEKQQNILYAMGINDNGATDIVFIGTDRVAGEFSKYISKQLIIDADGSSEENLEADLVLLAMGFVHPTPEGMLEDLNVDLDGRGNVLANTENYETSVDKIFAAGDMRRGQSLVVWAIREGRQCARAVDEFLMGSTKLPR